MNEEEMNEIREILERVTVEDLKTHARTLNIKNKSTRKLDLIEGILKFYETPNWLEDYYKTLDGFEKKYTDLIVQENFHPLYEEEQELMDEYNIKKDWYGRPNLKLGYMIKSYIPSCFKKRLLNLVPSLPVLFESESLDMSEVKLIKDDKPLKKFDDFLLFINKYKVKVTEKNNYINKSQLMKFINESNISEVIRQDDDLEKEIRNQSDTVIVNGIVSILLSSNIIKIKNGYFTLGDKYSEYVKLTVVEKAKMLLDSYINSKEINEVNRLTNYIFKISYNLGLSSSRNIIIDYIKQLPINEWVDSNKIKYYIRIKNYDFVRKNVGEVTQKDDYDNWYYNASFEDFEDSFVDTVIMDYLAVLGIVEVTYDGAYNDRYERYFLFTDYVKLTSFGASVLGIINEIVDEKKDNTLLEITENFNIIIKNNLRKLEHILYFDRFLDKIKESDEETIYLLDFLGLAKANDLGIDVNEIINYLSTECKRIPKNVLLSLEEWLSYLDKIKIRQVYILETTPEIMDKIMEIDKINNLEDKGKSKKMIIKNKKELEVKKVLEENSYFVNMD